MEQIPKKFLNEEGLINTDAVLKSYSELEKKIGTMVSVPGDDADPESRAKFLSAIGVPESESEYPSHELFDDDAIRTKFREIGLTAKQVSEIYKVADEFFSPALSEIYRSHHETSAMAELTKFFGDETKTVEALRAINAFGEKFLPAESFESLCATPQGIQSIYKMMQSMEPVVSTESSASGNLTDSDLRQMMRDPKYWKNRDPEYIRKVESGFKKLYS